jgi:flavin reductase (DIM6/NTAB) family NADH-FMN oxidoreductase RutF
MGADGRQDVGEEPATGDGRVAPLTVAGNPLNGVAIVATAVAEQPCAMVADLVVEMTDSPGTVLVFIDPAAPTHGRISRAPFIGLTVLSLRNLISMVGPHERDSGAVNANWCRGAHGGLVLEGAQCAVELAVGGRMMARARTVLVGSVLAPQGNMQPPRRGNHDRIS